MKGKLLEKSGIPSGDFPSQSVLRMLGTSAEENERQRSCEPNWTPTYVDDVVIGQHYLPRQPEDESRAQHLMKD